MKKAIANLLYRLAKWIDPALSIQEYNAKKYQVIVKDLTRLYALKYWVVDLVKIRSEQPEHKLKEVYKPIEPLESKEFEELNQVLEKLRYLLSHARENAEVMEKLHEDFTRGVYRLLDELEGAVRGDLTVFVEPNFEYYVDLGVIADVCNLIIENFRKDIQSLPPTHPIRQKYKVE